MKYGKIHPKKTLFLRLHVGSATGENKNFYNMTTNVNDGSPIVESEKSGKWFTLSWTDIINLATDAGIDES